MSKNKKEPQKESEWKPNKKVVQTIELSKDEKKDDQE